MIYLRSYRHEKKTDDYPQLVFFFIFFQLHFVCRLGVLRKLALLNPRSLHRQHEMQQEEEEEEARGRAWKEDLLGSD